MNSKEIKEDKMGIKYSTGKGAKVRHSTAMEWDDLEKAKKKYDPIKHSTGESASIKHATGTEFDYKVLGKRLEESGSGLHSKPQTEADQYLEHYHKYSAAKKLGELDKKERGNRSDEDTTCGSVAT